jgi:hypothetical protein
MNALGALERFTRSPRTAMFERCAICAAPIDGERHAHLVDLEKGPVVCGCDTCGRLFTQSGGSRPRYRTVPTRVWADPGFASSSDAWAALGIPVGLAFAFRSSRAGGWVVFYPSPAGPAEAEIDAARFGALVECTPLVEGLEWDIEALLVFARTDGPIEAYRVPIDVCFRLVGEVRTHWQGLTGGDRVRGRIEALFEELRTRAEKLGAEA